jgi:hypothetical protein
MLIRPLNGVNIVAKRIPIPRKDNLAITIGIIGIAVLAAGADVDVNDD